MIALQIQRVSDGGLDLTTAFVENGNLLVRLFNPEGDATPRRIALDRRVQWVQMVELDGRLIEELAVRRNVGSMGIVTGAMG